LSTSATITQLADALRRGQRRSADLVEESLDAVARHGERTNAFIHLDADAARAAAREADADMRRGMHRSLLHGIPISIKDLIDVRGLPTSCASRVMPATPASDDAPLVTRLRAAGAVLFGKTNLHEFALGTTSDESAWGPVRHPADRSRSAGGSSGGSAAAVATGMGVASIGTDTGGSIRIPSAACGVVGLKPAYGEVPLEGVVPLSQSLDHAGPIARAVGDAACLWEVLCGRPGEIEPPPAPRELRLGLLGGAFDGPLDEEVRTAVDAAVDAFQAAGIAVSRVSLPGAEAIPDAYVDLALPEAAAWHDAHLDRYAGAYSPGVATRLERGRSVPAVRYLAARETQRRVEQAVSQALRTVHALVTATLPITAPPLGQEEVLVGPESVKVPVRAVMLKHTQPFNLSGHPAISIPLPVTGLPVGLQLIGPRESTPRLLAVAAACERVLGMR